MKALLLDGSPVSNSCVAAALRVISARLESQDCGAETLALRDINLPINNPAYHNTPHEHPDATVRDLTKQVQQADIIVLGTPLYHGSFSGLIKTALDHLSDDAFAGKVVGALSNAQGPRNAVHAAQGLVPVARAMKGHAINKLLGTCRADFELKDGKLELVEPAVRARAEHIADELVKTVRLLASA